MKDGKKIQYLTIVNKSLRYSRFHSLYMGGGGSQFYEYLLQNLKKEIEDYYLGKWVIKLH